MPCMKYRWGKLKKRVFKGAAVEAKNAIEVDVEKKVIESKQKKHELKMEVS